MVHSVLVKSKSKSTSSELLNDAFTCSKALYNDGFNSWFTFIKNILKLLNVSVLFDKLSDMSLKSFKKFCKKLINRKIQTILGRLSN